MIKKIIIFLILGAVMSAMDLDAKNNLEKATFAGGCFWCMEYPFDSLQGVISTTSGYIGGQVLNPTYEQISSGKTGHAEAVEIMFDPKKVTFQKLLYTFFKNIDPTSLNQQFADIGPQYRTGIFYHNREQKEAAEKGVIELSKLEQFKNEKIMIEITAATTFYVAEEYHQNYYKKNPLRYKMYRKGSGREGYLNKIWGNK